MRTPLTVSPGVHEFGGGGLERFGQAHEHRAEPSATSRTTVRKSNPALVLAVHSHSV